MPLLCSVRTNSQPARVPMPERNSKSPSWRRLSIALAGTTQLTRPVRPSFAENQPDDERPAGVPEFERRAVGQRHGNHAQKHAQHHPERHGSEMRFRRPAHRIAKEPPDLTRLTPVGEDPQHVARFQARVGRRDRFVIAAPDPRNGRRESLQAQLRDGAPHDVFARHHHAPVDDARIVALDPHRARLAEDVGGLGVRFGIADHRDDGPELEPGRRPSRRPCARADARG